MLVLIVFVLLAPLFGCDAAGLGPFGPRPFVGRLGVVTAGFDVGVLLARPGLLFCLARVKALELLPNYVLFALVVVRRPVGAKLVVGVGRAIDGRRGSVLVWTVWSLIGLRLVAQALRFVIHSDGPSLASACRLVAQV